MTDKGRFGVDCTVNSDSIHEHACCDKVSKISENQNEIWGREHSRQLEFPSTPSRSP